MTDEDHKTWLVVVEELREELGEAMKEDEGVAFAQQVYDTLFPSGRPEVSKQGQAHGVINIKKRG